MRIVKAEVFFEAVPYLPPIRNYRPDEHTERPIPILKLHTDAGFVGLGEGGRGRKVSAEELRGWIGVDPLAVEWAAVGSPFEPALFDLAGKALGLPAHKLMGPKCRDRIPVSYWSPHMAPADTAREAAQAARRGFTEHKLKARPWDIVEQAQAISAATGPGYLIDVDPNFAFESLEQSLKLADQVALFPIRCFEDPFNWRPDFAGYAEFRARSSIRLAPHVGRASDVLQGIQAGAADLFNLDGLLARARHGAAVAEAAGLPVWLQTSSLSLGVLGAYALHVAATIPNYTVPGDMRHFLKEHDLLVGRPIDPREGHIDLPNGPGLGVELDEAALTRYCVGTITVEAE